MPLQIVTDFIPISSGNTEATTLESVDFVVVHYTADFNANHDASWIRDYFASVHPPEKESSAHYAVDDKRIVACVPENQVAYHTGSRDHNHRSIGAEICVNQGQNGGQAYKNAVGLFGDLCRRYPLAKLVRHCDILPATECPGMFTSDAIAARLGYKTTAAQAWQVFQRDVRIAASAGAVALAQAVRDVR